MCLKLGSNRKFNVIVGSDTSRKAHCIVLGSQYLHGLPDSDDPQYVRQFVAAPASHRSQINPSDEPFVDDLSLAIRAPKAVVNQAGIIVKTPDKRDIHIQIDDITTVIQLKLRIERETGIAEDSQRLIVGAKQLVDNTTLSSNGVKEGTIVHLGRRMTGGGFFARLPAFFASHKMILKSGGRILQPEAWKEEEEAQTSWPTIDHGKPTNTPSGGYNPYGLILLKNAEHQSNETRGQGSKSKVRWWRRVFQKSKET
ncbi:hypothetical protein CC77DRAFT_285155 [Alternaria alternata]|uniref:Ubiquitin-like domain-containing protein n=1 Tax=Alternaria alternata TaxID=5599 RepID=A0A177DDN0_ALTAL|nr:hypothetical protein CC77DRAFT_285155 [Alternaria alternata]OAG17262.1 hypothetical protein CC77DRAFT_285155 [Alternaria alternata]